MALLADFRGGFVHLTLIFRCLVEFGIDATVGAANQNRIGVPLVTDANRLKTHSISNPANASDVGSKWRKLRRSGIGQ